MSTFSLETNALDTSEDFEVYIQTLNTISCDNPFYKVELLKFNLNPKHDLKYFTFSRNNEVCILMPIYIRKIPASNFFDVVSPYGYSGPLFKREVPEQVVNEFWKQVDRWYKENNVVSEFIRFSLNGNHLHYSGTIKAALKNVNGEVLEDEELQWNSFKPKVRNNFRKALKHNLEAKIYHKDLDDEKLEEFYEIYIATMNRNVATSHYFYTLDSFKMLVEKNPESSILALISQNNITISAELILASKTTLYSFLGGTLSEYFNTRPNDFLKLKVMQWARENGYRNYVLGGGRTDEDNLYKYKKSFFPKTEDLVYYTGRKILNKEEYLSLMISKSGNSNYQITKEEEQENYFPLYRQN